MAEKSEANRPLMTVAALLGALGVAGAARGKHNSEADLSVAANMLLHARCCCSSACCAAVG